MTVHDPARLDPGPQQRPPTPQVGGGQHLHVVDDLRGVLAHAQPTQVLQRFGPQSGDHVRVPGRVDLRCAGAVRVEPGDLPGHLPHALGHGPPARLAHPVGVGGTRAASVAHDVRIAGPARALFPQPDDRGETVPVGQPAHPHDVLDHLVVGPPDLQHAGVHVRGEAAVELDLPAALLRARPDGAVVEEPEVERFADFVSLVTTEEDERAVGLHHTRRPPRLATRPTDAVHTPSLGRHDTPRRRSGNPTHIRA